MLELNSVKDEIKYLKEKMYVSIAQNGINDKETIRLSQELDKLIIKIMKDNNN